MEERAELMAAHANSMAEVATRAEASSARVQRRLEHLHETASIAPTVALRERGRNPIIVLFSEDNGRHFSISRIQRCSLQTRRYTHLVEGVWVPNHTSPHFTILHEYEARRLLLCIDVANAIGSWLLIRTTDLRLFFGTHPLEGSTYCFRMTPNTILERHYREFCASLENLRPNARKPTKLARFAAEEFVDLNDFMARCSLNESVERLCDAIRGAVGSTVPRPPPPPPTTTTPSLLPSSILAVAAATTTTNETME